MKSNLKTKGWANPISVSVMLLAIILSLALFALHRIELSIIFMVALGLLSVSMRIADQWEHAVVLRMGKFQGLKGPGVFFILPIIDSVSAYVDQRVRVSSFKAEQTLTKTISAYCLALEEQRQRNAHYLKEVGDQWRTPDLLFWGVNAMFGPLVLDLFADDSNAKCPAWYTAEDNALTQDWSARLEELGGAGFGNPPYSRSQYHEKQAVTGMTHIMSYASEQREKGGRYVFLLKSATSETWWPEDADHVCFIRGRIGFDLPTWFVPADDKQKPTSAFFAGAIVIFDKTWCGERFSYIDRIELEAKGRASMALAEFAAGKFLPPASPVQSPEVIIPDAVALAEAESRIWPLEVGLVFEQLQGAEDLEFSQQNKLKAHINQLWLERVPTSEIITVAGGLVGSMRGTAHA